MGLIIILAAEKNGNVAFRESFLLRSSSLSRIASRKAMHKPVLRITEQLAVSVQEY